MIPTTIEISVQKKEPQGSNQIHSPEVAQRYRCAQEVLTAIPHLKRLMLHDRDGMEFPITLQQYLVLKALRDQQYLIKDLAFMFKVSRPTMTRIIDGLEGRRRHGSTPGDEDVATTHRAKLVERVDCDDDRRLVYARITDEGIAMVSRYHTMAEENVFTMLNRISLDQLDNLEKALVVLREALEDWEITADLRRALTLGQ